MSWWKRFLLWLAGPVENPVVLQASKAIDELSAEVTKLRGQVKTVIMQPPREDEFKKYCLALDSDMMFRYLLFNVIDKNYKDLINNHNQVLYEMYRGRLLGIEELKETIHTYAHKDDEIKGLGSILGVLS
jgi:hypothetical protein